MIGEIDLSSPESGVFKKLGVSECPILIRVITFVDGRLIPQKKILFQRAEKGVCSHKLGCVWTGPNVFNVFYFCTGCMHRVHFTSSTRVLRKRQEVYILRGVLNFQRVRNLLGVQLPYPRK